MCGSRQTAHFANTEPDPLPLPSFFDTRHIRQVFQMCQDHLWFPEFRKQAKKTRCFQWFLIIYNNSHWHIDVQFVYIIYIVWCISWKLLSTKTISFSRVRDEVSKVFCNLWGGAEAVCRSSHGISRNLQQTHSWIIEIWINGLTKRWS